MPERPYDFTESNSWAMPITRHGLTNLVNTGARAYHCIVSRNYPDYWEQDYVAHAPQNT